MFGMTVLAAQVRIIVKQRAMHGGYILHLFGDPGMTHRATIGHRRGLPGSCVTGPTISSGCRVGCHTAQRPIPLRA